MGVNLVICEVPHKAPYIFKLLESNGVIKQEDDGTWEEGTVFSTLDAGVAHCEEQLLSVRLLCVSKLRIC